jgi:hypothetical protein
MLTESAITRRRSATTFERKLMRVQDLNAGVSYWGMIGHIADPFHEWLEDRIQAVRCDDLHEFARRLAGELNTAHQNRPFPRDQQMGLHVAGFHGWSDGSRRPAMFHVHNGHGCAKATVEDNVVTTVYLFGTQSAHLPPETYNFVPPTQYTVSTDMAAFLG